MASCAGITDEDPDPAAGKKVFVTAATFTGNLGGAAGADGKCQDAAEAADRSGTFKAWVSSTSESAIDRIADVGPWTDFSNSTIFADKAALSGVPATVLRVDETGVFVGFELAWTGTAIDGTLSANGNCLDWSNETIDELGNVGQVALDTTGWTDQTASTCAQQGHLYCFEQ